jgi:3-oxoacyl-[acyl-carrier protein] reductase
MAAGGSEFAGRRVVITGAAGIYGSELALTFAAAGADLFLSDIDAAGLDKVVADTGLPRERVATDHTDLMDAASIGRFVAAVMARWGAPDIVLNVAGIYPFGDLLDVDVATWDRVMAVNLRAPFLITQGLAKAMLDRQVRGSFINISSGSAALLRPTGIPYGVSKRGLEWLSQGFALDLAALGIRVNCIQPGVAIREGADGGSPGEHVALMKANNPMGRLVKQGDLSATVMFLASDAAEYVTGVVIPVSGGATLPRRPGIATGAERRMKAAGTAS